MSRNATLYLVRPPFVAVQYPLKSALQFSVYAPTPAHANALLVLKQQKYLLPRQALP